MSKNRIVLPYVTEKDQRRVENIMMILSPAISITPGPNNTVIIEEQLGELANILSEGEKRQKDKKENFRNAKLCRNN